MDIIIMKMDIHTSATTKTIMIMDTSTITTMNTELDTTRAVTALKTPMDIPPQHQKVHYPTTHRSPHRRGTARRRTLSSHLKRDSAS